jgi:CubicO group peptidase (beta-lactamase class C family)
MNVRTTLSVITLILCAVGFENMLIPSTTDINEHIRRVEAKLPALNFKGKPSPVWDETKSSTEWMKIHHVPGVSIAVINDFKIEWAKGYGVLKAGENTPVTTETIFEIGSTTKSLTAAAALHYVEKNLLTLDNDVNETLVSWKIPENKFSQKEKVTLRRLLTHTAGINRPQGGFGFDDGKIPSLREVLNGELPAENQPARVENIPGEGWNYSNFGYIIIQQLLEDVTGKSYGEIMHEKVFDPLGMKSATFRQPSPDKPNQNAALPHDPDGVPKEKAISSSALAHGGLLTTPSDLALFTIELMKSYNGQSQKILSQKMTRMMFTSQVPLDPEKLFGLTGQGLGWFLMNEGKELCIMHAGENYPGFICFVIAFPRKGQGAVIMTNGMGGYLISYQLIFALASEYSWPF